MFELLFQHIDQCKQILNTEYLVDDICKLVRTSTGKIEAVKGEHDDCLMSYLHAIYIYYHGDNLSTFGIFPSEHTIWGVITVDDSKSVTEGALSQSVDTVKRLNSPERPVDWDEYVIQDAIREETKNKELMSKFSFYNPAYQANPLGVPDNTVNISPSFFDQINGL